MTGLLLLALAACNDKVSHTNPYDPESPLALQVKGKLAGRVIAEAAFAPETLSVSIEGRTPGGEPVTGIEVTVAVDGQRADFSSDLPRGTYRVKVTIPGFDPVDRFGIDVRPEETTDAGAFELRAGRGMIQGRVAARSGSTDSAPPLDTRVTLIRLVQPFQAPSAGADCAAPGAEEAVQATLKADGTFVALGLAAGPYLATAEREGFVPAMSPASVEVKAGESADVGTLVLLSSDQVARVRPPANPSASPSATATNSLEVSVEVSVPPLYNGMRFSEDPTFADPARGDTAFVAARESRAWSLPAGDGRRTLFVQFRSALCSLSPTYEASVLVDTTPPTAGPPALASGAACTNVPLVSLRIAGEDPCPSGGCAGLYQMQVAVDGALDDEPWVGFDTQYPIDLGADGTRQVLVALRDAAGNTSAAPGEASVKVNTAGPQVGTPAISVADGATLVRSLTVTLAFQVGGATEVEVGNAAGLDGSAFLPLPPSGRLEWRLAEGSDGARTVHARFKDACGNLTQEYAQTLTLDRSARIRGSVRLEDSADSAGTVVSVFRLDPSSGAWADTQVTAVTGSDGGFSVSGLVAGTYRLDFSKTGYAARTLAGLALSEGGEALPTEITLAAARGDLAGKALLEGESNHDGIRVEAAPGVVTYTDATGAYLFNGLKVGDYTPTAQKGTAFEPASAKAPTRVSEGQRAAAADLVLHPVPGSLHGVVKLQGRAVHSGVAVAASGLSVAGSKQTASTTTDDAGAFSLAGLTAGTWRLTLTATGFQTATLAEAVLGPADDLDLGTVTLSPAMGSLEGNAKLADATNHEGIRVAVQQAGVEQQATFTAQNGAYRFASVPVGTYSVVATKGGYRRQTESPVVVEAQRTATVGALTLTVQAGDVWLEDAVGQTVGEATSLAQIRVRGTYPNAVEGRFCESPSVQAAVGGDPSTFTLTDCAWTALTYSGGAGTPWDAVALAWRASPCPRATDPLATCDGAKTVYVRVRDADGAESDWFELPVVLDRRAPRGVVVLEPDSGTLLAGEVANGGAAYSRSTSVRVLVSTAEDRSGVAAGDAVSGLAGAWLYRSPTDAAPVSLVVGEGEAMVDGVGLTAGADGARSLYLRVTDRAGNASVTDLSAVPCPEPRGAALPGACDSIFVDSTPPPSLAFAINPPQPDDFTQGSAYATSPVVRLGLDSTLTGKAEDQAVEATLSNDASFVSAVSQPLPSPKTVLSWVLSPGDGPKTVYLKVRDAAGNTSARFEASVQLVTAAPDVPLLSPVGAFTRSARPTLAFAPVSGASSYRLQLCDLPTFTGANLLEIPSLATPSYVPAAALREGPWYWRVKARNAAGLESAFSQADAFTVDTVAPSAPQPYPVATPTKLNRPTLSWTGVTDAALYKVELDTSPLFGSGASGAALRSASTPGVALSPDVLSDGTWHWRVQAVDAAGNASAFAAAAPFQVMTVPPANPAPLSPSDDVLLSEAAVTFSWSAPAGASAYLVDLSSSATFASFERTSSTLTSRSLTLADGTWYWRVLAKDAADNVSDAGSAPVRRVRIDTVHPPAPTLTAVPTPSNNARPTLSWSAVAGAASYQLTLDGTALAQAATSYAPGTNLADGTHVWTVAAVDAAGNRSEDAPPQSFVVKTTPPAAPSLVAFAPSPTNLAAPTVSWSGVADAASYTVQWDKVATFTGPDLGSAATTSTSHTLPLSSDGLWHWRVSAKDAVGNASAWSTTGSFTRDTAPPANPAPSSPAHAALVASRSVVLSWAAVADAAAYLVDTSQSATLATYDRQETSFASRGVTLSADGDWYWRVLARDAAGNLSPVATAPIRRVQVDTAPPAPPVLTAVLSPTNDATPVLAWSAVAGAASYQLTLDGSAVAQAATSYTPGASLSEGTHVWTVAAIDAAGNRSEDAPAQSFVVKTTPPAAPSLVAFAPSPTNLAAPTVAWSGVADAASYTVQWDKVPTFTGPDLGSASTPSTSHSLPLASDGLWHWRVSARDAVGNASAWSTTGSFTRDTAAPANPAPSSPAHAALVASRSVVLSWAAVADAAAYLVDTSQSATLATYDRQETSFTSRGVTLSADGDWYWRVLARDAAGNLSPVATAPIRRVQVDTVPPAPPVLTAVLSPTSNPRPTLGWAAVSGAAGYVVTLDGATASVAGTSLTPGSNLADGSHTWTAAALDAAGNRSSDAPAQSFLVDSTPPAAPTIVPFAPSPTNLASPQVSWSGVAEAASYTVQWDKVSTFNGTSLGSATTSSTSHALALGSDGTWYWRVRAADSVGNPSTWSSTGSLERDTAPPANPAPVSPAPGALFATRTVTLTWSAVTNVASYFVDVSQSATLATYERSETTLTSRTVAFTADGDWYWRVLSKNLAGTLSVVASAPIRKLTIDSSVPGSPVLTPVASPTTNPRPTLSWSAVAGAAEYVVTLDGLPTTVTAPATSYTPASTLSETTHVWTVAARTAAGNRGADAPPQSFLVDVTAPGVASAQTRLSGQDKSGPSTTLTRNSVVTVSLTGFPDGDIASMRVWETGQAEPTTWQAYSTWFPWVLSSPDGSKVLNVKVRDAAGNAAGPVAGSITLDTAAPQVVSAAINQKPYATSASVTLSFSVLGASEMRLSERSDFTGANWGAYGTSGALTFSGTDGLKVAYLQFRDSAGNETVILSDVTTLDTGAPYAPGIAINGGASSTVFALVSLSLTSVGADEMRLWGGVNDTGWVPFQPSRSEILLAGGGDKTVNAQFRDRAGNLSATASAVITYLPPPAPVALAATGQVGRIALTWGAASGATSYAVARSTVSGGPYTSIGTPVGTSFDDTAVTLGQTYFYVVYAVSAAGTSAASAEVSAGTVPAAPTGLAVRGGAYKAHLSWSASAGAASYEVRRATSAGGPFALVVGGSTSSTKFLDTGLTAGATYYYVVRAKNAAGSGPDTAPVGVVIPSLQLCASSTRTDRVATFPASQSGDGAPLRSFGSQTGMSAPRGVAIDTSHNEVFVTDGNSILVYPRASGGNLAPLRTISGALTTLYQPQSIAVDSVNDELFVANTYNHSVTVFARTASGNVAPLRTLSGAATTLQFPRGIAYNATHGEIAVAHTTGSGGAVVFFSRTANGNIAPLRTVAMGNTTYCDEGYEGGGSTFEFLGVTVDATNNEVLVAGRELPQICDYNCLCYNDPPKAFVAVYPRTGGARLRLLQGEATGLAFTEGNVTQGLAVNNTTNELYVASALNNSVVVHSRTANGDVAPLRSLAGDLTELIGPRGLAYDAARSEIVTTNDSRALLAHDRTASGDATPLRALRYAGLSNARAIATSFERDEIYAANAGSSSIAVFSRTATGDATPLRVIAGTATGLKGISGIAVEPVAGELFVADSGSSSVRVFSWTASGNAPPLRVISGALTGLSTPLAGLAVDASRHEVAVARPGDQSVAIYDTAASGDVGPLRVLGGIFNTGTTGISAPEGVLFDSALSELWVSCAGNNSLRVFVVTAVGASAPQRVISGAATGLSSPRSLLLDPVAQQVFVANRNDGAVRVFGQMASGNQTPLRTISGPSTLLSEPMGLAECN